MLVNTVTSRHGTLARLFDQLMRERERANNHRPTNIAIKKTGNEQTEADKHTNTNNGNKQRQTAERVGRKALGQLNERLPLRCSIDAHNDMQSNRYACRAYKQSQRSSQVRGEGNATAVRSYQRGEG